MHVKEVQRSALRPVMPCSTAQVFAESLCQLAYIYVTIDQIQQTIARILFLVANVNFALGTQSLRSASIGGGLEAEAVSTDRVLGMNTTT
ncbi:MAG: hypothetical protein QOD39_1530 [Mycobacterium sp.]|nr:hypothetical protein [Mycobacterium sp.]